MIDKAVILQDKRLKVHEHALVASLVAPFEALHKELEDKDGLPSAFQDRHKLPLSTTPTILQEISEGGLSRLITPVVTQGIGRGYLSFLAPSNEFSDLDTMVLQHAAVICAMEMARAKAISETEKRLRGDFLDTLILGNVSDTEAILEGDRYGHDMTVPHVALIVQWQGAQHPSARRLETLVNGLLLRHPNAIISRLRENEVRMFYKVEGANPIQTARELADELVRDARAEYPHSRLAIGIGSVAPKASQWRGSYREAMQAVDLAHKLKADTPLFIGDLGIYMFLSHPDYKEDLILLRDSTIGNLIRYEERQRADLLQTLNAFFEEHGNHTATADALNVHRNTLTYRMNRITEITGLDLNQPDVRLAVHLALKIHRLFGNE
jgi:purine catabolism regulator